MQSQKQFIWNKAIEHRITSFYSHPDFLDISKVALPSVTVCGLLLFSIFNQNHFTCVVEIVIWQYSWSYNAKLFSFQPKIRASSIHLPFPCCCELLFTPSHQHFLHLYYFVFAHLSRTSPVLHRAHTQHCSQHLYCTRPAGSAALTLGKHSIPTLHSSSLFSFSRFLCESHSQQLYYKPCERLSSTC